MCSGVSKSGSPAPRPITSLPCALRRAARAVTARVGEGLTRWTRRETGRVTDFPLVRLCFELPAILRDCGRAGHRERPEATFLTQPTAPLLHGKGPASLQARGELRARRGSAPGDRAARRGAERGTCAPDAPRRHRQW